MIQTNQTKVRCPGCGHKVVMPCLICATREKIARSGRSFPEIEQAVDEALGEDRDEPLTWEERSQVRRRLNALQQKRESQFAAEPSDPGTRELTGRLVKLFYLADRWGVSLRDAFETAAAEYAEKSRPPEAARR